MVSATRISLSLAHRVPRVTLVAESGIVCGVVSDSIPSDRLVVRMLRIGQPRRSNAVSLCSGPIGFSGADWLTDLIAGASAVLRPPDVGIEIPPLQLYTDVERGIASHVAAPDDVHRACQRTKAG